jgi:hypothetical protein
MRFSPQKFELALRCGCCCVLALELSEAQVFVKFRLSDRNAFPHVVVYLLLEQQFGALLLRASHLGLQKYSHLMVLKVRHKIVRGLQVHVIMLYSPIASE